MKKNVAGQTVGAQLNSKSDGSTITSGTTTVYVTGDNGSQATGSVSSGAATHKGHGFWTYAPAQAETNYDHVAFTFENSTGINQTVQFHTDFPQTGDAFTRLGAPAGASVSADIATVAGYVDTEVAAIKAKTDQLAFTNAGKVDASLQAAADVTAAAGNAIADYLLKRDLTLVAGEAARSVLNAIRFLRNKWSISGTTLTVTKEDDTTSAWTSTLTTNAAANPVTASDPA